MSQSIPTLRFNICPHCNSDRVIKQGKAKYPNGRVRQRRKCLSCGRTYIYPRECQPTSAEKLSQIHRLVTHGIPLRTIAEVVKVPLSTLQHLIRRPPIAEVVDSISCSCGKKLYHRGVCRGTIPQGRENQLRFRKFPQYEN